MQILIELTEEDAAAIWANHWKRQPIAETVQLMAERDAENYLASVSSVRMDTDLVAFRAAHVNHDDQEFQAVAPFPISKTETEP